MLSWPHDCPPTVVTLLVGGSMNGKGLFADFMVISALLLEVKGFSARERTTHAIIAWSTHEALVPGFRNKWRVRHLFRPVLSNEQRGVRPTRKHWIITSFLPTIFYLLIINNCHRAVIIIRDLIDDNFFAGVGNLKLIRSSVQMVFWSWFGKCKMKPGLETEGAHENTEQTWMEKSSPSKQTLELEIHMTCDICYRLGYYNAIWNMNALNVTYCIQRDLTTRLLITTAACGKRLDQADQTLAHTWGSGLLKRAHQHPCDP